LQKQHHLSGYGAGERSACSSPLSALTFSRLKRKPKHLLWKKSASEGKGWAQKGDRSETTFAHLFEDRGRKQVKGLLGLPLKGRRWGVAPVVPKSRSDWARRLESNRSLSGIKKITCFQRNANHNKNGCRCTKDHSCRVIFCRNGSRSQSS